MLKPTDPEETRPAAFRRKEQLVRWKNSHTDQQLGHKKDAQSTVQFDRGTVFLAACSQCDKREVQELLSQGVDPDTANVDGLTGLHQACIDDRMSMIECLVESGASINVRDNEGWTPLHATASCGYIDVASYLINNGADIAACNADGDLPIDLAEGRDMENLLASSMNVKNINAATARKSEETQMINDANRWIQDPSLPEMEDSRTGATALHVAAVKGYHGVIAALLQAGATINHQDFDGWTPLHAAAHWGQEDSCRLLIDADCDLTVKDRGGRSAIDVADKGVAKILRELIERKQASDQQNQKDALESGVISKMQPIRRRPSVTRMSNDDKTRLSHNSAMEEKVLAVKINEDDQDVDEVKNREEETTESGSNQSESAEPAATVDRTSSSSQITAQEAKFSIGEPATGSDNSAKNVKFGDSHSLSSVKSSKDAPSVGQVGESNTATPSSSQADESESQDLFSEEVKTPASPSPSLPAAQLRANRYDNRRPFVSVRDQGLSDRSSYPVTAGRSQYIPYYKRQQMEREAKAKEEKEAANAAASSAAVLPNATASSTATPPVSRSDSEPDRLNPERRISRFETPKRDDEAETNRKIKAKRARETRRSTQGVTQDDVKAAEATLKSAENGRNGSLTPMDPPPAVVASTSAQPTAVSKSDSRERVTEEPARRRAWGREEGRSSSFRKARDTIISGGSSTSSVPDQLASGSAYSRYRNGDVDASEPRTRFSWRNNDKENRAKDEEEDADKDPSNDNDKKPRLLRSRRNRRERRSTGVISYDESEKNAEEKEQDTSERRSESSASPADASSNNNDRDSAYRPFGRRYASTSDVPTQMSGATNGERTERPYSSRYSRRTPTSALDSSAEVDYRAQCEELKAENAQLKDRIKSLEEEVRTAGVPSVEERRGRRALELRLADLEEEHGRLEVLEKDNTRLKEENGALIRVISKLSK